MPMAYTTKLVIITCTAFLARQNPVSTMAKPACMKKTRAPPKITKKRLSEVLTWPSSAAISPEVGSPATSAATSAAVPVAEPDGSPAKAKPPNRNVEMKASSKAATTARLNEGRVQSPRGCAGGDAAHNLRADPGLALIIVVILSHGFVVRCAVCVVVSGRDSFPVAGPLNARSSPGRRGLGSVFARSIGTSSCRFGRLACFRIRTQRAGKRGWGRGGRREPCGPAA